MQRLRRGLASSLFAFALLACGDDSEATSEEPASDEPAPEPQASETPALEDDPLAGLDDFEALEREGADIVGAAPTPEPNSCALYPGEVRVWSRKGVANVVALGDDGIAGYAEMPADGDEAPGEEVFVITLRPGRAPSVLMRETLEHPLRMTRVAAPGLLAIDSGHLALAITDLRARVLYRTLTVGQEGNRGSFVTVGEGADQRFSPALASQGSTRSLAYTEGTGEVTHTWLIALDGRGAIVTRNDITPTGGTARAPLFLADGSLVFIDAREALSTVWRLQIDAGSTPSGEPSVITPLSNVFDPVRLAVTPHGESYAVAYTAVGQSAMTAVGYVRENGGAPTALVASSGYGPLHVDVADGPRAVFVADASTAEGADTPRELRIRWDNGDELAEALTIAAPARLGHIARHASADDGPVHAIVYGREDGVYASFMRCAFAESD